MDSRYKYRGSVITGQRPGGEAVGEGGKSNNSI